MEYRTLGRSGLKVSAISLGSWVTFGQSIDQGATRACMEAAYDHGVNFFDGAEAYGDGRAEAAMGEVFKATGWPRETLVISTKIIKCGEGEVRRGISRKRLVEGVDGALQRMGLDYVDLCFCHRPDGVTPAEEIVHAMNELIGRGKVLYWGTSEFPPHVLHDMYVYAERHGLVGPTMEQTNHSMVNRKRVDGELRPLFERFGLGTTIYSPLAQGLLTGKFNDAIPEDTRLGRHSPERQQRSLSEDNRNKVRQLTAIAHELGVSMAQLALAWCLKNPHVSTAIVGATRAEQVVDNIQAVDAVDQLDDAVMERIEQVLDNRP